MSKVYNVESDFVDSRLDRWFRRNVNDIPQSLLEKILRKGKITVNNKKVKSSYKLCENDKVTVSILTIKPSNLKNKKIKYKPSKKEIASSSDLIIFDNDDFVVINKPAGIPVQSGTKSKKNIIDILNQTKVFEDATPFTVHRLDKETTGVMIIAKNRKHAQLFTSLFRIRKIHKTYLGVTIGLFNKMKGTFIDNLIYYEGKKEIISKAITNYRVVDTNKNYSLVRLNPITGRKHQLRRQLLIHENPILGDSKYRISDKYKNKKNTLMLHAYKINFSINDKKYEFTAEPSLYFKKIMSEKYLKIY